MLAHSFASWLILLALLAGCSFANKGTIDSPGSVDSLEGGRGSTGKRSPQSATSRDPSSTEASPRAFVYPLTPPEKGRYTYEKHIKNEHGEGNYILDMEIRSIEDVGSSTYSLREVRTEKVSGGTEETVELWKNDGVYLQRRDTTLNYPGNTQHTSCTFEPPLLRLQYPLQIGLAGATAPAATMTSSPPYTKS